MGGGVAASDPLREVLVGVPGTREGASAGFGRIRGLPKWRVNIMVNQLIMG